MKNLFYKRETCRLCHSTKQELVVPMAGMPIGTPNFQVPDAGIDDPVFRTAVPLELYLCRDCGDLHILHVGNPEIQYRHYVYTTSISLGLREHFATYADDVIKRYALAPNSLIVELGSNDGSLLGFVGQERRINFNTRALSASVVRGLLGADIEFFFRNVDDKTWVQLSGASAGIVNWS